MGVTGRCFVDPAKLELVKQFRRHPTESETVWEWLRGRRCLGLKFRRQQVIDGFIVDFYCAEQRLAVEVDGPVHDRRSDYDQAREEILSRRGIRLLRIRAEETTEQSLRDRIEDLTSL